VKVLIVSDTHGYIKNLKKVLKNISPIDHLIHLGDIEGSEDYIESIAGCPVHMISGNNDFLSNLSKEDEFWLGKYHILITHGHYYGVSIGTEGLKEEGRARRMDIVMFGHTHKPMIERDDDIIVLNPGSLSFPRQIGRKPSFMIMEIDSEGEAHFTINYLEN